MVGFFLLDVAAILNRYEFYGKFNFVHQIFIIVTTAVCLMVGDSTITQFSNTTSNYELI
jgi:hypothetical protein